MRVKVSYFALLREQAGRGDEVRDTACSTAHALYDELSTCYGFTLPMPRIKIAINDAFTAQDAAIGEGDHIIFIPPIAGG